MMLEFGIGHKYIGGTSDCLQACKKSLEPVGWWGTAASFVIITYYGIIMGWAINYVLHAVNLAWGGTDTEGFFL